MLLCRPPLQRQAPRARGNARLFRINAFQAVVSIIAVCDMPPVSKKPSSSAAVVSSSPKRDVPSKPSPALVALVAVSKAVKSSSIAEGASSSPLYKPSLS